FRRVNTQAHVLNAGTVQSRRRVGELLNAIEFGIRPVDRPLEFHRAALEIVDDPLAHRGFIRSSALISTVPVPQRMVERHNRCPTPRVSSNVASRSFSL